MSVFVQIHVLLSEVFGIVQNCLFVFGVGGGFGVGVDFALEDKGTGFLNGT